MTLFRRDPCSQWHSAIVLIATWMINVVSADYPWTFDNDLFGGPDFWGLVNKHWKMCTVGQMQSPINIDPSRLLFDPGLTPLRISNKEVHAELENTGQLPIITLNETAHSRSSEYIDVLPRTINITGGPAAPYTYRLHHVIIHFGIVQDRKVKDRGSEHTIDRVRFPAEIQLLAYNSDLYENFTKAMTQPRGLLGISVIVDIGQTTNVQLRRLTLASQSITYKDTRTSLLKFNPAELLPLTNNYVTYEGSLSYPGCYETVTWVVMNNPIYVTITDLAIWNDLQQTEVKQENPVFMSPNYRPLRPLNNRLVRTNINIKYTSKTLGSCPSNVYLNNGYRSNPLKVKHVQPASGRHAREVDDLDADMDVTLASELAFGELSVAS